MVCSLLDISIGEENSESQKNYTVLEFSDNRGDEVVFKIQEISRFRTLEHLSIKLRKGNDAKVREYLGECYRQLKSEHTNKLKEIDELTKLLQDHKSQNDSLQIQVETQRRECSQRIEEERNLAAHEISQTHSEYRNKLEKEQKEFSDVFNTKIRELENQNKVLDYDLKAMTKKNMQNESTLQRISEENISLRHELQNKEGEHKRQLDEKNIVDQQKDELIQNVNQLKLNVHTLHHEKLKLEGDKENRDMQMAHLKNQFESLSQELKDKKEKVEKRDQTVRNVSQELLKANKIIEQLQHTNVKLNNKLKACDQIYNAQEKVVEQKSSELEIAREQLREKTDQMSDKQNDNQLLDQKLKESEKNVEDLSHKVESKDRLVQWLNKQLTDVQKNHPNIRLGAPPESLLREGPGGINFTASAMTSTSTPTALGRSQKENNNPKAGGSSIDPKYLAASSPALAPKSTLAPPKRSTNRNYSNSTTTPKGGGGLLRQNLSPRNIASNSPTAATTTPQSVYFKT